MAESYRIKRIIVRRVLKHLNGWHAATHGEIEKQVTSDLEEMLVIHSEGKSPEEEKAERLERDEFADKAKAFYYNRMSTTATLLLAVASVIISTTALIISAIAVFTG